MKLGKKFLSLGIAVILSLSLITVSAANVVEVDMDYMNAISVSGLIEANNTLPADIMLRLKSSSGELIYADVSKTLSDDEGNLRYGFDAALLSLLLPSDTYEVIVSGRNLQEPITDTVDIHGADRKLKVLKEISDASSEDAVKAAIKGTIEGKNNYDVLKFDIELYDDLETDDGNFVDTYLKDKTYDLSVDSTDGLSDEEILKIHSAIATFHDDYNDAIASALFATIDSKEDWNSWYNTYYSYYEFDKRDEITAIVTEVMDEDDFARRMKEQTAILSADEIKEFIYESALCTYVFVKTDSEVEKLVSDFPEYFTVGEEYKKLETYETPVVIGKVAGNLYDTCNDVTDALDAEAEAVADLRGSDDDNDDNNRGSVSVSNRGGAVPSKEENTTVEPVIFSDLESASWAEEAIIYLYNKGVVDGNPDGSFMPNAEITRAEFIKIVAEAFGLEEATDNVFADVAEGSWYASYVSKAYAKGIVKGDENNNFNPDVSITRQDMVTILYRALNVTSEDVSEATFTDKDTIADYAYPAVRYFSSKGIVNGFEDGSFGPALNTTRAQASIVLYKLLINLL